MPKERGIGKFTKTVLVLIILIPLGFYTKSYGGPGYSWVQGYLGGLLYEIFWCLFASLWLPYQSTWCIAAGVFLATAIIEILQLWHLPIFETLRNTFIGQAILRSSFDIWDFPHYLLGCILGAFAIRTLQRERTT